VAAACCALARPAAAQQPAPAALIPRETLFGNPDRVRALLSPDGTQISYLAAADGVLNVFVAGIDRPLEARPVTRATKRPIYRYFWAYTSRHILYLEDSGGDENWRLYSVDVGSGKVLDLTPFDSIPGPDGKPRVDAAGRPLRPSARLVSLSDRDPRHALVAINNRDPRLHDLYRVEVDTGKLELVQRCPEGVAEWVVDNDLRLRYGIASTEDGGLALLAPPRAEGGEWAAEVVIPPEDALTTMPLGFSGDNSVVYFQETRGRDTAALAAVDTRTGERRVLAEDAGADLSDLTVDPATRAIQAVAFNRLKPEWRAIDPAVRGDLEDLARLGGGGGVMDIVSRSQDDRAWLVLVQDDDGPSRYYLHRRGGGAGAQTGDTALFAEREALAELPLAPMHALTIPARDGLPLVCYLTLPLDAAPAGRDRPAHALPMVLLVHGGPWARDEWGYNAFHQLLANRGYAVLSVNYRGSAGFGKGFINAGSREWAGKMHDDLIDAVDWAVREKVADPARVAIMGGSYGGYAALVGLTFTPETFACAVDIVGPSNLVSLLETIPEYWKPQMSMWRTRVGDVSTEEGRKFLASRSPLTFVDRIKRPLLIGHGAADPRVKQAESDRIVAALEARKIPVTYVVFPDEGHGFMRPENRLAFYGITEAFLARCLGGRYEPLGGAVEKSSAQIRAGAEQVPGLSGR
jgi:dipeptidyl aminopeptidase/acylaminoacyl peptidase